MTNTPVAPTLAQALTRSTLLLLGMALVFTALLSATQQLTQEAISAAQRETALRLIRETLPGAWQQAPLVEVVLPNSVAAELDLSPPAKAYVALVKETPMAVVLPARSRRGYGGDILVWVAVDAHGALLGARVSQHRETPGLGDYIDPHKDRNRAAPWIDQFVGRLVAEAPQWRVRKDGGAIDAHAGATISARATTEAIARAASVAAQSFAAIINLAASPSQKKGG
jgi:electron transport complex protein RnfG